MKIVCSKILTLLPLLFMFACSSNENTVELETSRFETALSQTGNISFRFNKNLVGLEEVGVWDSIQYIEFDPPLRGAFKWNSGDELIFSPGSALPPATKFEARLTDKLLQRSEKKLKIKERNFTFFTEPLRLENLSNYWKILDGSGDVALHFRLQFNHKVALKQVGELLNVQLGGKTYKQQLLTTDDNRFITFYLTDLPVKDTDLKGKLELLPGLKALNGNMETQENVVKELMVSSPYRLEVADIIPSHNGAQGEVLVNFTQPVEMIDLKEKISLNPSIEFTIEPTESGIQISSEAFDPRSNYALELKEGIKGRIGGELQTAYSEQIVFGNLQPQIAFEDRKTKYLSKYGQKNLEVSIVNVDKVTVDVYKVYANNILAFLRSGYYSYDYETDDYYYDYNYNQLDAYGDIISSQEFTTANLPRKSGARILSLNLEDKLVDFEGFYVLRVRSNDQYYLRDHKIFSLSDLGMIVKNGNEEISVFINSVSTAEPLQGVRLDFIGNNNQLAGSAITNAQGYAVFPTDQLPASGFNVSLVTAELGDDFNILAYNDTRVDYSRFETDGKYLSATGLDLFPFSARSLYRPGETVNLAAIVRDHQWLITDQIPILIKIYTPTGAELYSMRKIVRESGSVSASFKLPETALTGYYNASFFTGNDVFITNYSFQVEEFMPDRIKVKTELDKKELTPAQKVKLTIEANTFFGPPATNRNYEVAFNLRQRQFYSKEFRNYNFSIKPQEANLDNAFFSGTTDNDGKAKLEFLVAEGLENNGILETEWLTTVFDETGRPVNRRNTLDVFTQDYFLGIAFGSFYFATGGTYNIGLVAVNKDDKLMERVPANATLIKHEYRTVLEKSGNYFRYKSQKEEKIISQNELEINGEETIFAFKPQVSGEYELRLSIPGSKAFVSRTFYAYGFGQTTARSFQVSREGHVEIKLDKAKYAPGDIAKVLLTTPFTGKVLLTVETDKVLKYYYVDAREKTTAFDLEIEDDFLPNVYLGATLFKPHDISDFPLTVAHGVEPLLVEIPSNQLNLEILATEKTRSNTKQKITVKAEPGSEVAIAVVDEGILQLNRFQTPDPYKFYYGKRALQTSSFDIYPYLFPEIATTQSKTGGDAMLAEVAMTENRINPLANERVKLVTFWSDWKKSTTGEINYEIDIPQFSGSLRVMAVGHFNSSFGAESSTITVADPLVMSVALPRVLAPGDEIVVPVILNNTTEKQAEVSTSIDLSGPLELEGDSRQAVAISPNREGQTNYTLRVKQATGTARVTVEARALGERFSNITDIPVRPAVPLQKVTGSGVVVAGSTQSVTLEELNFIPATIKRQITVGSSPLVQFTDDLEYLVRYPYGCLEQVVSSAFPQLYYGDIVKSVLGYEERSLDPNQNVNQAIKQLMLMQLYNGGLTYWPNQGRESWWGSAYSAHFLVEAQKAGYEVNEVFLDKLLNYLKQKLNEKKKIDYYYNGNQRKKIVPKEIPYSLYVLALAGKEERSMMNFHRANSDDLSLDGKYLLAAAYYLSGDKTKYREVLPKSFSGERSNNSSGGSFYSHVRDEALALNVLLEVDPDNLQIPEMSKHISQALKEKRYLNTQERSFGFLALGKIAHRSNQNKVTANLSTNGKELAQFSGQTLTVPTQKLTSNQLEIKVTGEGELYYFWEAEGVSSDGSYREGDHYLEVRRRYYDRNGKEVTSYTFNQNELVVVAVSIRGLTNQRVENVVISDVLPAGFEIENPRISDIPNMNWIKDKAYPDYSDIRDDRINLFVDVGTRTQTYYYLVRAVSKGTFSLGPIGADAMYNGEYHSYSGGGKVIIN